MSIKAAFALVILPPACGMTLLVSELAFATSAMRKAIEQGSSLPVFLSICVQRAALKTPPPFGRTLSFPESAARLSRGADSCPKASSGPLPQILSSRRGSGSRRHTRWAMYGPPPNCKRKVPMRRRGLRQCIRPVVEAPASGHDVFRALLFLTSVSASSALPNDRLRAGRFDLFSHQFS
jgi:hypothetical protein